jgi:glutamate carboxypeptidase
VSASAAPLLGWTRDRTGEMLALLREIVSIETPSHDPAALAALGARLVPEFEGLGLRPELVSVPGSGPLLRAGASGGVLLLGHLDTVWPTGTLKARPPRLDGDRFFGPGAFDMKAGLVIALFALKALAARGPLGGVSVLFTPQEEIGGESYRESMLALMRGSKAVLDFEPAWPGGAVKTARKGSLNGTLRVFGRAAHAGADFLRGASAILELAAKVQEVSRLTDLPAGLTVNVGVVRGGIRPNVIADRAEMEVDCRFPRSEQGDALDAALRGLRASAPGTRLEWEPTARYPPLERTDAVQGLYRRAKEAAFALGLPLAETSTGGASEASFAAALGLPTLDGLGADGDGAHAEDEHVIVGSMAERAAVTALLLEGLQ